MTAVSHVTDIRSNLNEQIEYAAKFIGKRESHKRTVFDAVYYGQQQIKTAAEIAKSTGLSLKRVLDAGKKLNGRHIINTVKVKGKGTGYSKDSAYAQLKRKIQDFADHPQKLKKLPTKRKPSVNVAVRVAGRAVPNRFFRAKLITVDDLEQFAKVRKIRRAATLPIAMPEAKFKKGVQRILGETGKFQDWGGEGNDLHTTRVRFGGKRVAAVFAFKGPGKKGVLTPARMGRNGDQIARLFKSSATVYALQYWYQVAESVYDEMHTWATFRSGSGVGEKVYYLVIDGVDSARIIKANPKAFK